MTFITFKRSISNHNSTDMKRFISLVLFFFIALRTSTLDAQQLKMIEGDLSALKSEKTIALEFTYKPMRVGKYDAEEDYINKKVAEMNKKEAGKGDGWAKSWIDARHEYYEPKFTTEFLRASDKKIDSNSKYKMIFHTTFIEPGFNTGAILIHKNPEIKGEIWVVETLNQSKVLAKFSIDKVVGREGYEFDTGRHVEGCYGIAGTEVGRFVK